MLIETDISREYHARIGQAPLPSVLLRRGAPRTLYETIYDALEASDIVHAEYDRIPRDQTFEEFAWDEFSFNGDESYLEQVGTMTYEEKYRHDNGHDIDDARITPLLLPSRCSAPAA